MKLWQLLGRIAYWAVWPGSWLYLRGSRRTRLLLLCGNDFLVVHNWLGAGRWNLPGGGLHQGEDPAIGLVREVFEETGVRLKPAQLHLLAEEPYRLHGFSYRCSYFYAQVDERPATRPRQPEITAAEWRLRFEVSAKAYGPDVIRALRLLDS